MIIGHTLCGHGPEGVIVCHGWFGDSKVFDPMLPWLDVDAYTYAFVDYRGYGKSKSMTGKYTVAEIASDVLALADSLRWKRFHVIGHSMGGKVVQRVALNAPDRVKSGIAVTPVPACGARFDDQTYQMFADAPESDEKRYGITDFSVSGRLPPRWVQAIVRASRESSTVEAFRGYLPSWAREDFSAEAEGLKTPIAVMVGEFDPNLTAEVMRATYLAWYPNAELQVIGNSGHYPMQETPLRLATLIEEFLGRHK
jgi:pimeloyl-ACP methyl ester carboxylesterase